MTDVNLGQMLSTTLKKYRPTLTDNIHESNAIFYALKEKGAIKTEDGGERIVEPLMYGTNDTAGSYDGYDQLDVTPQEGIDAAEFNWKQYSASITISGKQIRQNKGNKNKIIDILDAKTQQAENSLRNSLTDGIFSNGTGNDSKDLTGLQAMVLASGTYGGIDSGTYTWWQANIDSDAVALSIADMRGVFNDCTVGGKDAPDLIVTTSDGFEAYEAFFTQLGSTNVYGSFNTPSEGMKKMADGGFTNLGFKGVPIVWDESCPDGAMYFLNTKHMKLVVHEDANFDTTDFEKPEDQDALVAQILFMGNITCNRRNSFGALTAKTDL